MKAIILVAGYATRLYPLTKDKPKALLEVNKKPIINYIVEQIDKIDAIDDIFVVSNHKFAKNFEDWAKVTESEKKITVIDDGTDTVETRRGAIGDILFTIEQMKLDDEIMIIAGDNLFTYDLKDFFDYYKKIDCDSVCAKRFENKEMLSQFGIAELDGNNKIIGLEEKPENPKSDIVVYATYLYKKETMPMFKDYMDEGNNLDAPGHFIEWLYKKKDVYAYIFDGECYDVGTHESYEAVQKVFAEKWIRVGNRYFC